SARALARATSPLSPYTTLFRSTIPSLGDQIQELLQKLPDRILRATDGIERLVNSPSVQGTVQDLGVVLRDVDLLVRDLRTEVKRSEEHTSELQSRFGLVCRLLL